MSGGLFWEEVIETGPVPAEGVSFDAIVVGGGIGSGSTTTVCCTRVC